MQEAVGAQGILQLVLAPATHILKNAASVDPTLVPASSLISRVCERLIIQSQKPDFYCIYKESHFNSLLWPVRSQIAFLKDFIYLFLERGREGEK